MAGSFDANLRGLADVAAFLQGLDEMPAKALVEATDAIGTSLGEQFAKGCDPYGEPWAPLSAATLAKGRHAPPLTDTGALKASVSVVAHIGSTISIVIRVDSDVADFHQHGGAHLPQRKIVPAEGDPLPVVWEKAIVAAFNREVDRLQAMARKAA